MSKKFLTLFAIVALLVAAMAGTAFADDDVIGIDGVPQLSAIGGLKGADPLIKSADLYYIEGAKSLDVAIDVYFDIVTSDDVISADISADAAIVVSDVVNQVGSGDSMGFFEFTVGGFTEVPTVISVDGIALTKPTDPVAAQLTIFTKKVQPEFAVDAVELEKDVVASDDFVVVSFDNYYSYDEPALRVVSSDGKTVMEKVDGTLIVNSKDEGYFTVSFDETDGTVVVETGPAGPGEKGTFTYALVADALYIASDDDAIVAGVVSSNDIIATFTVTVEDPLADFLARVDAVSDELRIGANIIYDIPGGIFVNETDYDIMSGDVFSFEVWFLSQDVNENWVLNRTYDGMTISADMYGGLYTGELGIGAVWDGTDEIDTDAQEVKQAHATFTFYETDFLTTGIRGDIVTEWKADYHFAVYDNAKKLVLDPSDLTVWYDKEVRRGGGDGIGCDAGFGAFALLGLAGLATILRKKD